MYFMFFRLIRDNHIDNAFYEFEIDNRELHTASDLTSFLLSTPLFREG